MGLFNKKGFGKNNTSRSVRTRRNRTSHDNTSTRKSNKSDERFVYNAIGEKIYIVDTPYGEMPVKETSSHPEWYRYSGLEYCPNCHCLMTHKECFWECDICGYDIDDEESIAGNGYPSLESTYEDDFGEYFDVCESFDDDMPECCAACGGPWPDCEISCKIFDD